MYIPAENVYYEIVVKDESGSDKEALVEYALKRRVVPVSPNSFYAYLNVIVFGLRGLRIEQQAKAILGYLSALQVDFEKAAKDFTTLGGHLENAHKKYTEAERKFERFGDRLAYASSVTEVTDAMASPSLSPPEL